MTTALVVAERHGWFLRRYDPGRALEFLNLVETLRGLSIESVGAREIRAATTYLRRFSDQALTLADALGLNLKIMDRRRIDTCRSTDRHLAATGKRLVIHDA